ncbi:MAG: SAM-dependent methyltransferase [Clostridia bacterium]|nr:SAM-dependent methyltransferase [Clostridia bacterium]
MELSPRLTKIAQLIPRGSVVADIGTDHAYIPLYCFLNSVSDYAIAMDVNKGPLQRARENLKKYGFESKAELRLSDGLEKLKKDEADVIVIAGMGGLLIRDILEKGKSIITSDTLLLIQPMIAPTELRDWLFFNGFDITDEYVVREENKFYNIFSVKKGIADITPENRFVGKNLAKNCPETVESYLDFKIRVCNEIISGMNMSKNPDIHAIEKYMEEKKAYLDYKCTILKEVNN